MMKQIGAWMFAAFFGVVVVSDAMALTIKKGEVLTKDGVVPAESTESAKNKLAQDGYYINAGNLYLDIEGTTVSVALTDIQGKGKAAIKEIVTDAAIEQVGEAAAREAMEAALEADGITVVRSVEDAVAAAEAGVSAAINSADTALLEAYQEAVEKSVYQINYDNLIEAGASAEEAHKVASDAAAGGH